MFGNLLQFLTGTHSSQQRRQHAVLTERVKQQASSMGLRADFALTAYSQAQEHQSLSGGGWKYFFRKDYETEYGIIVKRDRNNANQLVIVDLQVNRFAHLICPKKFRDQMGRLGKNEEFVSKVLDEGAQLWHPDETVRLCVYTEGRREFCLKAAWKDEAQKWLLISFYEIDTPGFYFTEHATKRASERGIATSSIRQTIENQMVSEDDHNLFIFETRKRTYVVAAEEIRRTNGQSGYHILTCWIEGDPDPWYKHWFS